MFYNPNAIANDVAVLSTYVLLVMLVLLLPTVAIVAEVNAAVAGVDIPIALFSILLFTILLVFIGIDNPLEFFCCCIPIVGKYRSIKI
jgi:hypothetical protein